MTRPPSSGRSWRFPGDREIAGAAPPRARKVGALIDEIAARTPESEAVVSLGARWTYRELAERADALALGLISRGIGKDDRVAILMGNRPEWIQAWIAINKIGATVVGVSTWSSAPELEYVLRHSDAKMLIHADRVGPRDLASIVRQCLNDAGWSESTFLSERLPCLRACLSVDGEGGFDPLIEHGRSVPPGMLAALDREIRPSDVALLLYTSGSTATPKGVQLVHRAMIENAYDIGEAEQMCATDRCWLSLPLFWSAGSSNSAMATLTHGATIVLQEHFDAGVAASLLRDERCTHYFAFPNVTRAIHQALGADVRLPAARVAVSSPQPEILDMLQQMGFTLLLHPYGATEDYGFATINDASDPIESLSWCVGRALPGIELKICDPLTGTPMPEGAAGEIALRGNVTVGYYKDEDKNRSALDDDGYFHTGDIGILHPGGRLQFLGRGTEMIKTSGFNVSPAEVENVLLTHPDVGEAHVVGIPDDERGQRVVACVKLSRTGTTKDALREHCAAALSSYKVPRDFAFFDAFPLTSTGKVSKAALRDAVARVERT